MAKIPVAVMGATGAVGQRFIQLLESHPWFEVKAVMASDRSAGRRYADACTWLLPTPLPAAVQDLIVLPVDAQPECPLAFSALPSDVAGPVEEKLAQAGYVICSNASAHRMDEDVPLLIPEVNPEHTALIARQQTRRGGNGFIVTSANCSTTQIAVALRPLHTAFYLQKLFVVTLQAISGAGYPGVASLDIVDNIIPYISNEEEKLSSEPRKLLGALTGAPTDLKVSDAAFTVSAQCNRVAVRDGHTACLSTAFAAEPDPAAVIAALEEFRAPAGVAELPSTPAQPIVVRREPDRPQPIRDRNLGNGMAVVAGRVRTCSLLQIKFVVLGHNTIRGAAGGAIHNAELLLAQGWLKA